MGSILIDGLYKNYNSIALIHNSFNSTADNKNWGIGYNSNNWVG